LIPLRGLGFESSVPGIRGWIKEVSAVAEIRVNDELWRDFRRVVNMSVSALMDWLKIAPADPDWEVQPDPAGLWTGYRVLNILRKHRADLDAEDIAVMRRVIDDVRAEPTTEFSAWHRRLLSIGHDPLKKVA
jgi:uncharacterized protein DUF3140